MPFDALTGAPLVRDSVSNEPPFDYLTRQVAGPSNTRLPMELYHATTIPKPQLVFKDRVNNSRDVPPWRPAPPQKPHARVKEDVADLDLSEGSAETGPSDSVEEDSKRKWKSRCKQHPYYQEISFLQYPESMSRSDPPIPLRTLETTPFTFVDTPEALDDMILELHEVTEIAVDLEHHSLRSYYGFTSLIQLSSRDKDWIIDPLRLRAELRRDKLGGIFADPAVVKVRLTMRYS